MQDYLNDIIIKNFHPLINQKIYSVIKDAKGKVLCATNLLAESIGLNSWQDLVGLSYQDVSQKKIERAMEIDDLQIIRSIQDYFRLIFELEMIVMDSKIIVSYVEMIPYRNTYQLYLCTVVPLLDPDEKVVAIQLYYSHYDRIFGISDYFELSDTDNSKFVTLNETEISDILRIFTPRELEIIYLLLMRFSQYQISDILQIKRGTIAKVISDQICPKLNIVGSNTRLVIEKINKMGGLKSPPKSLLRPLVLVLDEEINRKLDWQ